MSNVIASSESLPTIMCPKGNKSEQVEATDERSQDECTCNVWIQSAKNPEQFSIWCGIHSATSRKGKMLPVKTIVAKEEDDMLPLPNESIVKMAEASCPREEGESFHRYFGVNDGELVDLDYPPRNAYIIPLNIWRDRHPQQSNLVVLPPARTTGNYPKLMDITLPESAKINKGSGNGVMESVEKCVNNHSEVKPTYAQTTIKKTGASSKRGWDINPLADNSKVMYNYNPVSPKTSVESLRVQQVASSTAPKSPELERGSMASMNLNMFGSTSSNLTSVSNTSAPTERPKDLTNLKKRASYLSLTGESYNTNHPSIFTDSNIPNTLDSWVKFPKNITNEEVLENINLIPTIVKLDEELSQALGDKLVISPSKEKYTDEFGLLQMDIAYPTVNDKPDSGWAADSWQTVGRPINRKYHGLVTATRTISLSSDEFTSSDESDTRSVRGRHKKADPTKEWYADEINIKIDRAKAEQQVRKHIERNPIKTEHGWRMPGKTYWEINSSDETRVLRARRNSNLSQFQSDQSRQHSPTRSSTIHHSTSTDNVRCHPQEKPNKLRRVAKLARLFKDRVQKAYNAGREARKAIKLQSRRKKVTSVISTRPEQTIELERTHGVEATTNIYTEYAKKPLDGYFDKATGLVIGSKINTKPSNGRTVISHTAKEILPNPTDPKGPGVMTTVVQTVNAIPHCSKSVHENIKLVPKIDPYFTMLTKKDTEKLQEAQLGTNSMMAEAAIASANRSAQLYASSIYSKMSDDEIRRYANDIAFEMAYETFDVNALRSIRDNIRRKAKRDNINVQISDLIKIVNNVLDNLTLLVLEMDSWSEDRELMKRISVLQGISEGVISPAKQNILQRLITPIREFCRDKASVVVGSSATNIMGKSSASLN